MTIMSYMSFVKGPFPPIATLAAGTATQAASFTEAFIHAENSLDFSYRPRLSSDEIHCGFSPVSHPGFEPLLVQMKRDQYSEYFVIERMTSDDALHTMPLEIHDKLHKNSFVAAIPDTELVYFFLSALDGTLEAMSLGALTQSVNGIAMMCSDTVKLDQDPLTALCSAGPMFIYLRIMFMAQKNVLPERGPALFDIKPSVLSYYRDFFNLADPQSSEYEWALSREEADLILEQSAFEFFEIEWAAE